MVDPLLLLRGYKFSLRIYVVFFSSDEAYISSKGLVKLASKALATTADETHTNTDIDASMHMTNSGRESVMRQEDLDYLWRELDGKGIERDELWRGICGVAADTLLVRYPERIASLTNAAGDLDPEALRATKQTWKDRRKEWGIPKILGLDFVVEASSTNPTPWLVEVNRFPGLEPRDEEDRKIKHRVVRDAWKKASERLSVPVEGRGQNQCSFFDHTVFDSLCVGDGEEETSSLERLRL
mmetsp:Transcript_1942/g.4053  ORF Transcript_1942/g.4053 Transcript_1942/m.4053 type:complete len:240 (+) Transcript_1942:3-722(+)